MNMKFCSVVAVMLVVVLVCGQFGGSKADACNAEELKVCAGAIQDGSAPSQDCCAKLKSQEPCLCGFIKDPSLKQYVNSPNAKKVASQCGVSVPSC